MKFTYLFLVSIIFIGCEVRKEWLLYGNNSRNDLFAINSKLNQYKYRANGVSFDLSYGKFVNRGDALLLKSFFDSSNLFLQCSEEQIINQLGYKFTFPSKFSYNRIKIMGLNGKDTIRFWQSNADSQFIYLTNITDTFENSKPMNAGKMITKILVTISKKVSVYARKEEINFTYNVKNKSSNSFNLNILPCEFNNSFVIFDSDTLLEIKKKEIIFKESPSVANSPLKLHYLKKMSTKNINKLFTDLPYYIRCKK